MMKKPLSRLLPLLGFSIFFLFAESVGALEGVVGGRRRGLLSFKENPKGSNLTYNCSPSGPCVPCQYSEKKEAKYRCSETGYRIPFKCAPVKDVAMDGHGKKSQKSRSAVEITRDDAAQNGRADENGREQRSLLDESSKEDSQAYVTYRSCIPPPEEEKLSVLGFEGIVFGLLLISGSFVFLRKRRSATSPGAGAGRIQMSSREHPVSEGQRASEDLCHGGQLLLRGKYNCPIPHHHAKPCSRRNKTSKQRFQRLFGF